MNKPQNKADQYNDPKHNYKDYWTGREYENAAEELAIKRLLGDKRFSTAVDIGGGYGRLSKLLTNFADQVVLAEPSEQQLDLAKDYLKSTPAVELSLQQANKLEFADKSVDLAVMVRVMHHLPEPEPELKEISRILKPQGLLILEVANYAHARNRLKHLIKGQKLPEDPVDIRSEATKKAGDIAFVNHNPKTVIKQLAHAGFKIEKVLSVSNLRSPGLKKVVPKSVMMSIERLLQRPLAHTYFGPSIFFLCKKIS